MIATGSVLQFHLAVDPDGEPQRTDQVHLHGERVEQHGAFEVVVGARCALDAWTPAPGHPRRAVLGTVPPALFTRMSMRP